MTLQMIEVRLTSRKTLSDSMIKKGWEIAIRQATDTSAVRGKILNGFARDPATNGTKARNNLGLNQGWLPSRGSAVPDVSCRCLVRAPAKEKRLTLAIIDESSAPWMASMPARSEQNKPTSKAET